MPARNTTKHGNGGKLFSDMCTFIKDKCNEMKDDNMTAYETMEALNERFIKESDKLQDTEKTALNVLTLLMPVLDAFSARQDETLLIHDTKINRLQGGVRNIEYANDALDQQSRRDHLRVTGLPEVEGDEDIIDTLMTLARAMKVVLTGKIGDAYRTGKKTPGKNRQVIVKFENRTDRFKFLASRKELKQTDFKDVYVNEDLTPLRFKLSQLVRKNEDVKNAHTRDPFTCSSHCVLWFAIDDKLLFQNTLFGVVYIPPDGSLYSRVDMFNEIENVINESDLQVCLLGDFNAHCSNCNEYVDIESNILDFCNVPNIEQSLVNNLHILDECGIPVVRQSQDKHKVDNYGKKLLELCRSLELFFVNGRVGNDRGIGLTTCNNSVMDYAIVSPNLFRSIVDFNVLIFDPILSDIHKPICLHLCTSLTCVVDVYMNNSNVYDNDMDNTHDSNIVLTLHGESESIVKPIWARDRAPVFTENLDDASIDELLNRLEDIDPKNTDNVTVNNVVEDCITFL
ncbi:unnamed protein product [Mytilus coruscus]|uniref:Endonuclease/exonuclease/phosphatase domain-containing protein n=1 Tax=Mytilus coruscus TaxID=42192 RepID=A0A6J8A2G5_MYTCO|nr:unnamed protein product [Mytilus coruscus]